MESAKTEKPRIPMTQAFCFILVSKGFEFFNKFISVDSILSGPFRLLRRKNIREISSDCVIGWNQIMSWSRAKNCIGIPVGKKKNMFSFVAFDNLTCWVVWVLGLRW